MAPSAREAQEPPMVLSPSLYSSAGAYIRSHQSRIPASPRQSRCGNKLH